MVGEANTLWPLGQSAYDCLSSEAIAAKIRAKAHPLGLDPNLPTSSLLPAFDVCWNSPDPYRANMAQTIASEVGWCLATLLFILHQGHPENRTARPEWEDSVWEHWGRIQWVWLGGGLMQGNLGHSVVHVAAKHLAKWGCPVRLERAVFPSYLPLIGAALRVPMKPDTALVLDFGGSWVKRAKAHYRQGALASLKVLSALEAPHATNPSALVEEMAAILEQTLHEVGQVSDGLELSLAAYVAHNCPLPAQGGLYTLLAELGPNSGQVLTQALQRPLSIRLIHDGTAAALAVPYRPNSAVIQMGTALGVGFAGKVSRLLTNDFHITI